MKTVAAAMTLAAALTVVAPVTAHADGAPTVDQVVAVMAELTDPGRPLASKGDIVTPALSPDEAGPLDDHLNHLNSGGYIPFNFVVTDIQPASGNTAGATVAAPNTFPHRSLLPAPIVLVDQGSHWSITHDAAVAFLNQMWSNCHRRKGGFV